MISFYMCILILCVAVILCLDIIHIIRTAIILHSRREKINSINDTGVIKRRCWPYDIDIFMHMNNGNYLKHCDIARIQFWKDTKMLETLFKLGGSMTLGGSCNRYRRAINLFTKFTINTKVISWDDTAFYIEHTFVRDIDGFICFISLCKQTVIGIKPEQIIEQLGYDVVKPDMLPELRLWIESTKASSERLRKKS